MQKIVSDCNGFLLVDMNLWSKCCLNFSVIGKDRSKLLILSAILTMFDCFIAVQLLSCAPIWI